MSHLFVECMILFLFCHTYTIQFSVDALLGQTRSIICAESVLTARVSWSMIVLHIHYRDGMGENGHCIECVQNDVFKTLP